jgi:hypothetical protein
MEEYNFVQDSKWSEFILEKINNEKGVFIGRIAGSDYESVRSYVINNDVNMNYYNLVKMLNGYFDKETDEIKKKENFKKYLDIMLKCYKESEILLNPCAEIQRSLIDVQNNKFNKFICENKPLIHYYWIESVTPFLNDFKIFAQGKKILIVSPFSESIKFQYKRKDLLLKNYTYPDFELVTYDTPITYNNEKDSLSHIETNNWLEQCEKMENEIMKLDFDIALLSCGSYAMYLGNVISKKMNKKAIYIGGIMNIFFNIYGKRYANVEMYDSLKNLEYEIVALEKSEKCDTLFGGKSIKSESLLAYF